MSDDANSLLNQYGILWQEQANFRTLWNTTAQFVMPAWDNFIGEFAPGVNRNTRIFDSTAILGNERFGSAMEALGTPRGSTWHKMNPGDEELKDDPETERCLAAAVELTKLARLLPAALTATIALGGKTIIEWLSQNDIVAAEVDDIAAYQANAARTLKPVSQARVPLAGAENARIVAYRPSDGGIEHLAIVIGEPKEPVLIRLHSECFTGDLLGSLRCDCGDQLRGAIQQISQAGSGVLIYLAQEGRGIGLVNKLRAYQLQDAGADTIEANEQLGFDADERVYMPAAEILKDLGFKRVRLMTNNPEKVTALEHFGIDVVERVPHAFPANPHNERYLLTKANKSGHLF